MEIHYKGYCAKTLFTAEADIFYGEVINCEDLIVFQAKTLQTLEKAMQEAVNQYLGMIKS